MSSVFEVPVQLALLLQLAAADPSALPAAPLAAAAAATSIERRIEMRGFAYSEARWLTLMHRHGRAVGLEALADRIFRTRTGLIYVPVASERAAIATRRTDAAVALAIAGAAARDNAERLTSRLGRAPTPVELCLAHIADEAEASALIDAATREPSRAASELAPVAALAHPALFFASVRARSAGEVRSLVDEALLRADHRAALQAAQAPRDAAPAPAWATTVRRQTGAALRHAGR